MPSYSTNGAIYMDEADPQDGKNYIYVSFVMGSKFDMHFIRIKNHDLGGTLAIDWHYMLEKPTGAPAAYQSMARQLFPDLSSTSYIYIAGMYNNVGTIMKLDKNNGRVQFKLDFKNTATAATDVSSIDQIPDSSQFVGCGQVGDSTPAYASFFKADDDGSVKYVYLIKPVSASPTVYCSGIVYNATDSTITLLLTTNVQSLMSSSFQATAQETLLYKVSDGGSVLDARHVSLNKATTGTLAAPTTTINMLRKYNEYLLWSGYSKGYNTKYNSASFVTSSTERNNAYTFRYLWNKDNSYACLYEFDVSISTTIKSACKLRISSQHPSLTRLL